MSVLVLTAGVYSASDSGHNADIMWDIYVGGLSYDGESTYTNHSYQIELYEELSSGSVQATYEFAHFVHNRTKGKEGVAKTKKVGPTTGEAISELYEWDGESETISVSVGDLDPDDSFEIEGYTRLEIRKGGKLIKVPGKAELKVTEFKMFTP